jgi:predicted deacylase
MEQHKRLSVGSAVAKHGRKTSGFIDVPTGPDPGTRIPVSIIAGGKAGPVLALTAGIHGSEPSPVLALERLRAEIDPGQLSGTIILVHIANVPSFEHRTIYRGPWDQKNLNRVFPGDPKGTASERIAHAITTQVIDQADYLIDLHSGDGNEELRPYSYWNHLGVDEAVDLAARELALAFGIDHIVIDRGRPRDPHASVFCSNTAHVRGKPAVTTEAGGLGVPTKDAIAINVRGVRGVLRHLGMLREGPTPVKRPVWLEPSAVLTSPVTGLWYPAVHSRAHVRKGTRLGHLTDYFGKTIATVKAPLSGIVLYVVASPAMTKGEPVAMVAQPSQGRSAS